ncbi:MAG TPA: MauE/DoxX family redox-associated membrane protein [Bryobacteraceae bacterium]|nr:MauE/DoxX family redox-associated membrane protein [Bryobacteraceae bacterium]
MRGHVAGRIFWLKVVVSTGLIAGFLLSPKLWLSSRMYPLTPVSRFLQPIPRPYDYVILVALLLLLAGIAVAARPAKALAAFVVLAAAYALYDQSRWQPWFYQYSFMLAALCLFYANPKDAGRRDSALDTCRFIVAAVYFWSGVHKANSTFVHEAFPWLVEPFAALVPEIAKGWLRSLGFAAPIAEAAIGIGLITTRFRNGAVIAAVAMHAFILASIGPLTHNWDNVIWPWNVAMAGLVVLLFWQQAGDLAGRGFWRGKPVFQKLVVLLFGVAPVFSFLNLWDGYPSFELYSGNNNAATIYMADSVADRLPDEIQEWITVNDSDVDELNLFEWSFSELNVPPYGEIRVFQNIGKQVCAAAGNPREMALVVQAKSTWLRRRRLIGFDCKSLSRVPP